MAIFLDSLAVNPGMDGHFNVELRRIYAEHGRKHRKCVVCSMILVLIMVFGDKWGAMEIEWNQQEAENEIK